jgi:predicted glycoside hydrolase/deacetylase ChbG (UPF0249 family)
MGNLPRNNCRELGTRRVPGQRCPFVQPREGPGEERAVSQSRQPSLAERLGHDAESRLVILNCDDLGCCHAANIGVYEALREGLATSASLMMPCPWAREAAWMYRGEDVGVHLVLNAEYEHYRWGPLTQSPSLLDGDGGMPRTIGDTWEHADLEEVHRECKAQIERAVLWGFDVSHLDAHMGTLQLKAEFFDVYLDLAEEFRLPVRMFGEDLERFIGFPARELARERGVVYPDHFVLIPEGVGSRRAVMEALGSLQPGVTELYFHPAAHQPELEAMTTDWQARVDDLELLTSQELEQALSRAGAMRIGYRALQRLMRDQPSRAPL